MAVEYFIEDFGYGLPLIHHALTLNPDAIIHTRNRNLQQYATLFGLAINKTFEVGKNSSRIYIGSSSKPDSYNSIIHKAKLKGNHSSVYMDNWVNYSSRIINLPNEMLVSDPWAFDLCKETFPRSEISIIPNYYLEYLRSNFIKKASTYILYIDSPLNNYNNQGLREHGKNCKCTELLILGKKSSWDIRIRFHPGYELTECDRYLVSNSVVQVSRKSLLEDLESAHLVIGPISYVHYISENLGVPSFVNCLPNSNYKGPKFRELLI